MLSGVFAREIDETILSMHHVTMWKDLLDAFREITDLSQAKPMQVIAWQAAVFGTLITLTQLCLGLVRQHREDRRQKAKFGYDLLDVLFKDEWSSEFLYGLDTKRPADASGDAKKRRKTSSEASVSIAVEFQQIFVDETKPLQQASDELHRRLDATLYFFDRFEHAIRAGLTSFDDVKMPTNYYVTLLVPSKAALSAYARDVGYRRVLRFLNRFKSWRTAGANTAEVRR